MYEYCECSSSDEESVYGGNIKIFGPTPVKKTKKKRKQRPNPRNEEAARLNKKLIKNLEVGPIQRAIEDALYKKDYAKYNELTKYNKQQGVQFQIASIMSSLVRLKNEYNQIIDVADSYGTNVDLKESIKTKAELSLKTINDLYNKALGLRTKGNKIDEKDKLTIKNIEEEIRRFANNYLELRAMGDRLKSKYSKLNPEEIEKMKEKVKEMRLSKESDKKVELLYDLGIGSIDKQGLEEVFADPTKKKAFQNALDKKRKKSLLELKHLDELLLDLGIRVDLMRTYRSSLRSQKSSGAVILNDFFDKYNKIVEEFSKIKRDIKNKVNSKEDVVKLFNSIENEIPNVLKKCKELINESDNLVSNIGDPNLTLPRSLDEIKENISIFRNKLKILQSGINMLNAEFKRMMTSFYDKTSKAPGFNINITSDDINNYPFLNSPEFGIDYDGKDLKYPVNKQQVPAKRGQKDLAKYPNKKRIADAYDEYISRLTKNISELANDFKNFKNKFNNLKGDILVNMYNQEMPIFLDKYDKYNEGYTFSKQIYGFLDDIKNKSNRKKNELIEDGRKKKEEEKRREQMINKELNEASKKSDEIVFKVKNIRDLVPSIPDNTDVTKIKNIIGDKSSDNDITNIITNYIQSIVKKTKNITNETNNVNKSYFKGKINDDKFLNENNELNKKRISIIESLNEVIKYLDNLTKIRFGKKDKDKRLKAGLTFKMHTIDSDTILNQKYNEIEKLINKIDKEFFKKNMPLIKPEIELHVIPYVFLGSDFNLGSDTVTLSGILVRLRKIIDDYIENQNKLLAEIEDEKIDIPFSTIQNSIKRDFSFFNQLNRSLDYAINKSKDILEKIKDPNIDYFTLMDFVNKMDNDDYYPESKIKTSGEQSFYTETGTKSDDPVRSEKKNSKKCTKCFKS